MSFLDVWMVMCICSIFLVLLEFSLVTALIRTGQRERAEKIERVGLAAIPAAFGLFNVVYWSVILS